jgi:pimeloyl-ACP methyl ester carboxylesterase
MMRLQAFEALLSMADFDLSTPRVSSVLALSPAGFHRMAYTEWGDPTAPAVICVHGLTRNGRDFDFLAQALAAAGRRVACPDIAGRGQSAWLADPALYVANQYGSDCTTLIARLGVDSLDWVGTSMGGLIGMGLAAMPETPIRRLVINDIGPLVPQAALQRIADYVGQPLRFTDLAAVEAYMRETHVGFGPLTDAQWGHMARHGHRRAEDGSLSLHYDPAIALPFRALAAADLELWALWEQIRCPVLVLRGSQSDLLTAETAEAMSRRGPKATVVEIASCGHAPSLMAPDQIALVRDWLVSG